MLLNNKHSKLIIKIGSGFNQSKKYSFKAKGLDLAVKNKILVPKGYLITQEFWGNFDNEIAIKSDLLRQITELPLNNSISVRSSFSIEDQTEKSYAGMFETVLSVNSNHLDVLADALKKVSLSSKNVKGNFRKDILVMEMIPAKFSGVAFTECEYEDDWINWTSGLGIKLVSGYVPGDSFKIPKLRKYDFLKKTENNNNKKPVFYNRLQLLLKKVRTIFGEKNWDIEWADDGFKCWLLQIRPITSPLIRNDWFGLCNHKEILPELPSVFMNSLINECAPKMFNFYHQIDSELPKQRLMVESFKGRSYFNLSLLSDMLRKWGVPTKLLSESMGGVLENNFKLNLGRVISNWPVYLKLFILQINALKKSRIQIKVFKLITKEPSNNIQELIQKSKLAYISLVHQMLSLTMVMGGPVAFLRFMNTLSNHSANHITPGTRILKDLNQFIKIIQDNSLIQESLLKGEIPKDKKFLNLWKIYIQDHGHRGIYESDLSQPRFRENQEYLLKLLSAIKPSSEVKVKHNITTLLTLPIWLIVKKFIYARENTRYEAMKSFDSIRKEWLDYEKELKIKKAIPLNSSVWNFTLNELSNIDTKVKYENSFYLNRIDEIKKNEDCTLPDNLKRKDFLKPYLEINSINKSQKVFSGMGLTTGKIDGTAWVLKKPNIELPESHQKQTTILIAPAVDAGWIHTFSQVSGVAVNTGGDLSHGSIILRELGIPAITNATGIFQNIKTGDKVSLHADQGVLLKT
jgi:rifampicin phosphotransferase